MKKIFLFLLIVSLVFFAACSFNSEKSRIRTIKVNDVGSVVINSVEMKILRLDDAYVFSGMFEKGPEEEYCFLYPAEQVPDNIKGKTIELIYRLESVSPLIVEVINIRILNQ